MIQVPKKPERGNENLKFRLCLVTAPSDQFSCELDTKRAQVSRCPCQCLSSLAWSSHSWTLPYFSCAFQSRNSFKRSSSSGFLGATDLLFPMYDGKGRSRCSSLPMPHLRSLLPRTFNRAVATATLSSTHTQPIRKGSRSSISQMVSDTLHQCHQLMLSGVGDDLEFT